MKVLTRIPPLPLLVLHDRPSKTHRFSPGAIAVARLTEDARQMNSLWPQFLFRQATHERESAMIAELSVLRPGRKPGELGTRHVNERLVIAALEIDIGLCGDAVIDDHAHAVRRTDRRYRATDTVAEQSLDLLLGCQLDVPVQRCLEVGEAKAV